MIDQGETQEAKYLLDGFTQDEYTQDEVDVQILAFTLSGIVNENEEHIAKAEQLTSQQKGTWSERRQWFIIPKITI